MNLCKEQRPRRAFTLVELVIVVLVVGILTVAAAPRYIELLENYRIDSAAQRIRADLSLARDYATSESTTRQVIFDKVAISYEMPGIADIDHPDVRYSVDLSGAPYYITGFATSLGGDSTVVFDHYGQPDEGGSIVVQYGSQNRTINIDEDTGKATVQ